MDSTDVKPRVKPTVPPKPRPLSIGSPYGVKAKVEDKVEPRESRPNDRQWTQPSSVPMRPNRNRSSKPRPVSLISPDSDSYSSTPKPTPPRKPAHVKAAAMARKATKQSEPTPTQCSPPIEKPVVSAPDSTPKPIEVVQKKEVIDSRIASSSPVPSVEPKSCDTTPNPVMSDSTPAMSDSTPAMPSNSNSNSKKDMSHEDYKKMMAEKRRLAREQAEREAEAERVRLEKENKEEEDRRKAEEEEQRRLEEEQLRLIEMQKKAEEERLMKAMEEKRLREEEDNRRKAEEERLRQEKEEKEKRAKEEAERQRLELEERLKRDEEERLERKKKLEAIMSRTRKTPQVRGQSPTTTSLNESPEHPKTSKTSSADEMLKSREDEKNEQNLLKNDNSLVIIDTIETINGNKSRPDLVEDVDRAVLQMQSRKQSDHTNGNYQNGSVNNVNNKHHIDDTCGQSLIAPTIKTQNTSSS